MQSRDEIENTSESTIGSDGAHLGQSPGGELPVERRATSGPVVSLEERERVDEPFEPWARRQIEKLAAILLPLESSMSKMRERVYEIVREEIALVRGGEDPHAETKRTGEGRAEAALSGNVAGPSTQPVQASPTGVREGVSAVDEGSAASRQAAPFPDPIPAWMPSAHELRNAHANRNYAFQADASDYEPFERIRRLIASRSPSKLPTPEDVAAPIRAALEASRSPSHELVEAADALRNEMTMPSDGSFAPFVDRSLKDKIEAYDAARSRHASGAQPDSACDEIGWLVEITGPRYWTGTPGCGNWTADSRAAMRFARRQDAEAACRHLAPSGAIPVEHAWVSHRPAGAQPSGAPAPASAQGEVCECGHPWSEHVDGDDAERHARRYGWTCVEDGCECAAIPSKPLPAPAESAPAQDGEPTLEDCQRAAIEATRKLHPNASDLALLLSPDEAAQVAAVRALCLASRARDASWRIEVRGSQPQCWVVVDPSGDCGEQSFTVGPCFDEDEREDAEHFARMTRVALERMSIRLPSPALAAIVEAGDAMRNYFDETTLTMNRVKDKDAPGLMWALTEEYVSGATPILTDWDRARAALPKDGA